VASPRIIFSPEAHRDLLGIWLYIRRENALAVADAFLARIHGALEIVASAPHIGRAI